MAAPSETVHIDNDLKVLCKEIKQVLKDKDCYNDHIVQVISWHSDFEMMMKNIPPQKEETKIKVIRATTLKAVNMLTERMGADGISLPRIGFLVFGSRKTFGITELEPSVRAVRHLRQEEVIDLSTSYSAATPSIVNLKDTHFINNVRILRDADGNLVVSTSKCGHKKDDKWNALIKYGCVRSGAIAIGDDLSNIVHIQKQIRCILLAFIANGCKSIVLGAWGCGEVGNSPATIAKLWKKELEGSLFQNQFDTVYFAVPDKKTCTVFGDEFSPLET